MSLYGAGAVAITNPTGAEKIIADNGGAVLATMTAQQIANLAGTGSSPVITALDTVGAGSITAAGLIGKVTVRGGAQSNTGFADTFPTAAALIAALTDPVIGQSWEWTYENTTDANATLTSSASVVVSGITLVPGKTSARFLVTYSAAGAFTVVGISQNITPNVISGTIVCNGATQVVTADKRVTANSTIIITLKTIGGTVSPSVPYIDTITAGTGFTTKGTALDTSTYNYLIIN